MSAGYGRICGVLVSTSSASRPRRCYAKGQQRYGGRCREHADVGDVALQKPRLAPRCGFARTANGLGCKQYVLKPGDRCGKHDEDALLAACTARREELEERIGKLTAQQQKLDRDIAGLEVELERITPSEVDLGSPVVLAKRRIGYMP